MALKLKLSGWGSVSISGRELEYFWLVSSGFSPSLSSSLPSYPNHHHHPPPPQTDIFSSAVSLHCVLQAISWGCLSVSVDFSLSAWPLFFFSRLAAAALSSHVKKLACSSLSYTAAHRPPWSVNVVWNMQAFSFMLHFGMCCSSHISIYCSFGLLMLLSDKPMTLTISLTHLSYCCYACWSFHPNTYTTYNDNEDSFTTWNS